MKVTHTVISYAKQTIQSFRMKANHSHLVCDNCKYILEDKAHVILSCPLYNDFRKKNAYLMRQHISIVILCLLMINRH